MVPAMGVAYAVGRWQDLFVASAGASAALTGLVFVAVSVNIERILKFEGLPERALQTLVMLLGAVLISLAALSPARPERRSASSCSRSARRSVRSSAVCCRRRPPEHASTSGC
jgi:drug/metabolite transporter (DMT)-like permease